MKFKIALLEGDGIGPEVIRQSVKVLNAVGLKYGHDFVFLPARIGANAIENIGTPFPQESYEICMNSDAVLLGAIGDPKYDKNPGLKIRPEQGLLEMRKKLELFANIRPVKSYNIFLKSSPLKETVVEGVDFVIVRELTGGLYYGKQGRSEDLNSAFDTLSYSRFEIERVVDVAMKLARTRRKKLTVVDKANVLETSRLWRETVQSLSNVNKDVEVDYLFVDNAAMQIICKPKTFDVIVTENMFGDILSDEASVITGSLGLLPSASIGVHTSVFEPIHGSYPQAAGKNIANPLGMILSSALMLEMAFNLKNEADAIKKAVERSLEIGIVTADITQQFSYSTSLVGDWIANNI